LYGCSNYLETRVAKNFKNVAIASETAIDAVIEDFKNANIILLGEYSHSTVNEQLFVANNIQKLYDAGFRYLFLEGGANPANYLPGSDRYNFVMFYPWINAGWRYEEMLLFQAIDACNSTLPEKEQIKVIFAEPDSNDEYYYDKNVEWMNLRDGSAAETIIGIMDSVPRDTKALIIYGGAHGSLAIEKKPPDQFKRKYNWLTVAYRLKEHYGESFLSYMFFYSDAIDFLTESKLVLSKNIHSANLAVGYYKKRYDGFIVEPKKLNGTYYQYNPTNENLKYIFDYIDKVGNYALDNRDAFRNAFSDTTYMPFDSQGQFLMGLYYLKMYFGDKFDYAFFRSGSSKELLTALNELKAYAFTGGSPSDYIKINIDHDSLMLYHKYMADTLISEFTDGRKSVKGIREDYLSEAYELFPEDLWALYWLGFTATEKKQYAKALYFFHTLFKTELASCMEILPLTYRKAALCAGKLKDKALEVEYNAIADSLYNEFGINVEGSTYAGYPHGK